MSEDLSAEKKDLEEKMQMLEDVANKRADEVESEKLKRVELEEKIVRLKEQHNKVLDDAKVEMEGQITETKTAAFNKVLRMGRVVSSTRRSSIIQTQIAPIFPLLLMERLALLRWPSSKKTSRRMRNAPKPKNSMKVNIDGLVIFVVLFFVLLW